MTARGPVQPNFFPTTIFFSVLRERSDIIRAGREMQYLFTCFLLWKIPRILLIKGKLHWRAKNRIISAAADSPSKLAAALEVIFNFQISRDHVSIRNSQLASKNRKISVFYISTSSGILLSILKSS